MAWRELAETLQSASKIASSPSSGKVLKVSANGTGVEWADDAGGAFQVVNGNAVFSTGNIDTGNTTNRKIGDIANDTFLQFKQTQLEFTADNNLAMVVQDTNVGIGTSSPTEKLHVAGNIEVDSNISLGAYVVHKGDTDSKFGFASANRLYGYIGGADIFDMYPTEIWFNSGNADIDFQIGASGASKDAFVVQGSSGNIGIGTDSPSTKLHVASGAIRLDSSQQLQFGGGATHIDGDSGYMAIDVNSAERIRIDSSGRVGIGTVSPSEKLHIVGELALEETGSTSGLIKFRDTDQAVIGQLGMARATNDIGTGSANLDMVYRLEYNNKFMWNQTNTNRMTLTSTGLGIGTTSPSTKMHIVSSTTNGSGAVTGMQLTNSGTTVNDGFKLLFTSGTSTEGASIINYGKALDSSALAFNTGGNNERLRITEAGNVGIGTSLPTEKLELYPDTDVKAIFGRVALHSTSSDYATFSHFDQRASGVNYALRQYSNGQTNINSGGSQALSLSVDNSTKVTVKSSGFVGIGTTSPNGQLAIHSGSAGGSSAIYDRANELVIENNDHAGITIKSPTDKETSVFFGDADDSSRSGIRYNHDGDTMTFQVASSKLILDLNSRISLSNNDGGLMNTIFGQYAGDDGITGDRNSGFGDSALRNTTSGVRNTAIGEGSMYKNTTGGYNVAVGRIASYYNVTGSSNTSVGAEAMFGVSGQSHTNNTGIGYKALFGITTGGDNVAVGYSAGLQITDGAENVLMGKNAGRNGNVSNNTYIGFEVGQGVSGSTNATNNTGVGHSALKAITTGSDNTAIGMKAGENLTTASYNTFINNGVGATGLTGGTTTGNQNVGIGYASLTKLTSGTGNVGIGTQAGMGATTASNNIIIGFQAGLNIASGQNNVILGWRAGDAGDFNNVVAIGYNAGSAINSADPAQSVFVGYNSGASLTSALHTTAVGAYSLDAVTTGNYNTSFGYWSSSGITTGAGNVALGYTALYTPTTATDCVAVGNSAMYGVATAQAIDGVVAVGKDAVKGSGSTTTGINGTVGIGHSALKVLTTGGYNTAVGYEAGKAMTANASNTIMGYGAFKLADGNEDKNVVIGAGAGDQMNSDQIDNNVIIGKEAWRGGTGLLSASVVIGSEAGKTPHVRNVLDSVFIGHKVAFQEFGGGCNYNVGIGTLAMSAGNLNDAHGNVAVGWKSMEALTQSDNNVAIGRESLKSITSGAGGNIALGYLSGRDATGTKNVYIGYQAGMQQTSGSSNINIGNLAGQVDSSSPNVIIGGGAFASSNNSSSGSNVIVGYEAGVSINSANSTDNVILGRGAGGGGSAEFTENIAIGTYALDGTAGNASTGQVAIGHNALTAITSGISNTAIGYQSGLDMTTGNNNTLLGWKTGENNVTGANNTYIGSQSGVGVNGQSHSNNTAVGASTLNAVTTGDENTVVGSGAGLSVTTGYDNVFVGHFSGKAHTTGDDNTFVGHASGTDNTNGRRNTLIGHNTSTSSNDNATDQIVIGSSATGVANNTAMIGHSSVTDVYMGDNGSSWSTTSDGRLKENVKDWNVGLDAINKLRIVSYNFKEDNPYGYNPEKERQGIIAQEAQEVIPEMVSDKGEWLSANQEPMIWALVNSIKELTNKVNELEIKLKEK